MWDIDNPHLYYQKIKEDKDEVEIYYGLRTIDIQNIDGINRVCLNNKPIIINGLLDQGYWKDTLFIPNTDDGYEIDILNLKPKILINSKTFKNNLIKLLTLSLLLFSLF